MAVIHLTNENFEETVKDGQVMLDFWATWCGPCRMQAPILEELDSVCEGNIKVCKIDVDEEPALAQRFGVMSIPTLISFRDGKQIEKRVGVQSLEQLQEMFG